MFPVLWLAVVIAVSPATREVASSPATVPSNVELRRRGLDHGYNLDYPEALALFQQAIAADASDATAHRLSAAALWMMVLFRQGNVTAEDYLGQAREKVFRTPVPADVTAAFNAHLDRAIEIAEQRVRANPRDADAHFQLGAASGIRASFVGTVEGRVLGSLGPARRAYREQARCLELDPRRKDAGLIVGLYRYGVSQLSLPKRLLARMAGFSGGRDEGIRLVEEAAAFPSDIQTNALFSLIIIYNREGRHADALRVIRQLQAKYPRNRLLALEAGSTALRAGRAADALQAIDQGRALASRDSRPRAYGEEARWRYYRGAALGALGQLQAAQDDLRSALAAEARPWVHGRAHVELGRIALKQRESGAALRELHAAQSDCRADGDAECEAEAEKLLGTIGGRE
jgi:tetratricopeptide (TPR) repeat protein